jgi:LacI family transcriptional regulator
MDDVAREAGVSVATVSRVLSGTVPARISAETRKRVMAAAVTLNYRVDPIARALRSQSTASLGLVVPNITNPFFPALIQAVEVVARRSAWSLILTEAQDDPEVERNVAELLVDRRVDALLISPCDRLRSRKTVHDLAQRLTVVQLDRSCTNSVAHVGTDQAAAIKDVIAHLLEQGCTRLAFIGAPPSEWSAYRREAAFRKWAQRNQPDAPILIGESSVAWGKNAVDQILTMDSKIDGIIAVNDIIAVGALRQLDAMGIGVPDDVSVTGFDDTLISQLIRPELTSVTQPVLEMAEQAFLLATKRSEYHDGGRTMISAELKIRASSRRRP